MQLKNEDKFDFTYSAPTEAERREIESIKRQYSDTAKKDGKLEKLRSLNNRVIKPPMIIGITVGVAGVLILGLGMAMALEWGIMLWGVIVGIAGVAATAAAYPVYKAVLKHNKQKYGQQIIDLSNEILNNKDEIN